MEDCVRQRNVRKDLLRAKQLAEFATNEAAKRGKSIVYADCLSANVALSNICINHKLCSKNYEPLIAQQETSLQIASDLLESDDQRIAGRLWAVFGSGE